MKKYLVLLTAIVSGCASMQAYLSPGAQALIADAKATCGFVMQDASAEALINFFGANAQAAADAVCKAVNGLPILAARRAGIVSAQRVITVKVDGVTVKGHMVQ